MSIKMSFKDNEAIQEAEENKKLAGFESSEDINDLDITVEVHQNSNKSKFKVTNFILWGLKPQRNTF